MGKRKRTKQIRPWCWYCEKDFEDQKVLVDHQRAKHFKCEFCNKKLATAGGMAVHAQQVHKQEILRVPNVPSHLTGRDTLEIEIFGMEGIPYDDLIAYEKKKAGENASKQPQATGPKYNELTPEQLEQQIAMHRAGTAGVSPVISAGPTTIAAPADPAAYYSPAQPYPPTVSAPPANNPASYPGGYDPYYQSRPPFPPPPQPGQQYPMPPPPGAPPGWMPPFPAYPPGYGAPPVPHGAFPVPGMSPVAPAMATSESATTATAATSTANAPIDGNQPLPSAPLSATSQTTALEGSKKKASTSVLIYNQPDLSPEEQRAQIPRYAITAG